MHLNLKFSLDFNGEVFQGENKQTIKVIYDKHILELWIDQKSYRQEQDMIFKSWYRNTDDNKKIKIENDSKVVLQDSTTFYADWTAKSI